MYPNYNIPNNFRINSSSFSNRPTSSYSMSSNSVPYSSNSDERFLGPFVFPFLLGGVTGAALAPAFFGGYNRPCCGYPQGYSYPQPYPQPYPVPYPYYR